MEIKEELIEDMQDGIDHEVSGFVADKSNRLLAEGLGKAAARAAARASAAVAMRPTSRTVRPAELAYQVKLEAGEAIQAAVTSMVSGTSSTNLSKKYLAEGLSQRVLREVVNGWERNFEFEEGWDGVKRKAVDKSRRSPVSPPARQARRGSARAPETVTIDGAEGGGMEGRTTAVSGPSSPEVEPSEEAEIQALAAAAAASGGAAGFAEGQPGGGGEVSGAGERQPGGEEEQPQQQPAAAGDVAHASAPETASAAPAAATSAPASAPAARAKTPTPRSIRIFHGGSSSRSSSNGDGLVTASPPNGGSGADGGRPVRKRRKSAEAGGWRSRYDKDEFESGEALLSSSDSAEAGAEDDSEGDTDDEEGFERRPRKRGSRSEGEGVPGAAAAAAVNRGGGGGGGGGLGGGGAEDEWSDVVDVGVDDDGDEDEGEGEEDGLEVSAAGGAAGRAGKRKAEVAVVKKRSPPNAWKRRCADGNCQLGASFGRPGNPAKYCSAHKDAGMVNVTHRLCEEPGWVWETFSGNMVVCVFEQFSEFLGARPVLCNGKTIA